ncbi:hypothetical protein D9M72_585300 [compost metagenome]
MFEPCRQCLVNRLGVVARVDDLAVGQCLTQIALAIAVDLQPVQRGRAAGLVQRHRIQVHRHGALLEQRLVAQGVEIVDGSVAGQDLQACIAIATADVGMATGRGHVDGTPIRRYPGIVDGLVRKQLALLMGGHDRHARDHARWQAGVEVGGHVGRHRIQQQGGLCRLAWRHQRW